MVTVSRLKDNQVIPVSEKTNKMSTMNDTTRNDCVSWPNVIGYQLLHVIQPNNNIVNHTHPKAEKLNTTPATVCHLPRHSKDAITGHILS